MSFIGSISSYRTNYSHHDIYFRRRCNCHRRSDGEMRIDPNRLKGLRKAKDLSRAALAKMSKVSAKQIQRLESPNEASEAPREVTLDRLASALKVKPEVLTGEAPLPASDPPYAPPSVRVRQRLSSEAQLAYDLVQKRYGVRTSAIMNMAPLFFVLLAEGSLSWRKEELAEMKEAINRVLELDDGSNRKLFAVHAHNASEDSYHEDEAIDTRNLFDDPYPDDYRFSVGDKTTNPFTEYLQKLSEDLNVPGLEIDDGFVSSSVLDDMPSYSVCKDDLEKIVPLGSRAFLALRIGDARISDIPDHLRPESAAEQRQQWLASKVSGKTIQWVESLVEFWNELGLPAPPPQLEDSPKELAEFWTTFRVVDSADAFNNEHETTTNKGSEARQ